jgi:hypothetical protein
MAGPPIVGRNVIVGAKARGGCEPGAAATGRGASRPGTLRRDMGQVAQTLGPPEVAELRVGKLWDGPTRGIKEVAPMCFRAQRVAPEVKVEHPGPSERKSL